jgi:hypothetical protein
LHPSAPGTGTNGGVAIGGGVQKNGDETNMQIGYGEGWARLGPGGSLELRTTPQGGWLSYELPLTSGTTAIHLRPGFGFAILRFSDTNAMGMTDSETAMVLHPGVSLIVNADKLYVAPRFGIGISSVLEGDGEGNTAYSGAISAGYRLGRGYSFELSVLYSRDPDADEGIWTFVPSLGVTVP